MFETKPELIVETGRPRRERPTISRRSATSWVAVRSCRSTSSRGATTTPNIPDHLSGGSLVLGCGGRRRGARPRPRAGRSWWILDSDHSQVHVEAESAAYAPLVPVGCYVIVEDSTSVGFAITRARPARGGRDLPGADGRVRDRSRAREVPHHVEPERLPAARALGAAARPEAVGRRPADDGHGTVGAPEDGSAFVPVATRSPASSTPGCVKTYSASSGLPGESPERAARPDVDPFDREAVGNRVADVRGPVDRCVERLGEEERVALERRPAVGVDVELRHARVLRHRGVDPGAVASSREDGVLRARRSDAPTRARSSPRRRRPRRRREGSGRGAARR